MLNATSRIAVGVQHLPDWEVDWDDTNHRCPGRSYNSKISCQVEAEGEEFHRRAVHFVMQLLVTEFDSLSDLNPLITNDPFDLGHMLSLGANPFEDRFCASKKLGLSPRGAVHMAAALAG